MSTGRQIFRRALMALLVGILAATGVLVAGSAASANPVYHAVDADNDPYNGIYLRNSNTDFGNATRTPARYIPYGTSVELICGTWGVSVGLNGDPNKPNYNRRWHQVRINGQIGWIPDRYLDTPNKANQLTPGEAECGNTITVASAPRQPTTYHGLNIGYSQGSRHKWGSCMVEDFKGGPLDWVIVSYEQGGHLVRNGMLWGWFDNGGAAGALGCPTSDEYDYMSADGMTGVRQNFVGGSLFWNTGMNHAQRIDPNTEKAIQWAWGCRPDGACTYNDGRNVARNYAMYCLGFVNAAFRNGQGVTLTGGPRGSNASAYQWWDSRPANERHAGDVNAPRGTLVIWGQGLGRDGHIALSLGGGWAISTKLGNNRLVHVIKISDHSTGYKGWVTAR